MSTPWHLGFGIITPFQRDLNSDFVNDGGENLVKSCLEQLICTRGPVGESQGEIPWRTDFGSAVPGLRHRPNDFVRRELARATIQSAIRQYEPRVLVEDVSVDDEAGETVMSIRVRFSVIPDNMTGNRVLGPLDLTVEIPR